MKTSRLSRVIQLLTALQSGRTYSAVDLAGILSISRRMIFRDLNELKKIGVPCSFDKKLRGYRIDPAFFFSTPTLDSQEALGLLLLVHKLQNNIRFPFGNSALKAALKIESELPEKTKRFCHNALDKIFIKTDSQETLELLDNKFSQLLETILNKRILTFNYLSPTEDECKIENFCAYKLVYSNNAWYVLGKIQKDQKIRIFKLNYIKELTMSDKYYAENGTFDMTDFFGRAWSMVPEGKIYNIKLRFLPEAARTVADVQWHSTQKVSFQSDGSLIMEFRVDGLNEITWWVLGYGDTVQVLAPDILREKITKIAGNIVRQNT
ncbi:MAG: hypothetical protein A2Y10_00730 [Planctomycetes bacterium GWF2_41_51]|nr:MAG: hypothetical protein A2Y10_00730 [Planctomycetes bacterium GWF2_41_51]HBG25909.1 hypothetical protein [Phycisphaerales bacterium]